MDEEVDESLVFRLTQRVSKQEKKRSSVLSLERSYFDLNRDPSIGNKKSFIQVMSLQGSQKNEDIHEMINFEGRRRQLFRNSNHNENEMEEEINQIKRRSSHQKKDSHECSCQGSCSEFHCPCFNEPLQLCLMGQCCQNCIIEKNKRMKEDLKKIKLGCLCKNSKCQKSYCKCYQSGKKCDSYCLCRMCENRPGRNQDKGEKPKKKRKEKTDSTQIGCSCKKSNCLKKYCKCYSEGKQCGQLCCCEDCRNKFEEGQDVEQLRIERQRYGRIDSENDDEVDIDCYFAGSDYQNLQMPGSMQFEHPNLRQAYDRN